jgi:hypothetical protein
MDAAADDDGFWFQPHSTAQHTAYESKNCNRVTFPEYIITHFDNITQPAKSPDVSGCNYILWGHLKNKVYVNKPHIIRGLKECITNKIRAIDACLSNS